MRTWLKRLGLVLGGITGLGVLFVLGIYAVTSLHLRKTYEVSVQAPQISRDSATIVHGRHFAVAIGKCGECHGSDFGGKEMINDPAMGRLWASNLTGGQGGIGSTYTDEDWVRALRHGVNREGKPLVFMPSDELRPMSDADLAAVIAFMQSIRRSTVKFPGLAWDPLHAHCRYPPTSP